MIRKTPTEERPRERCLRDGPEVLSLRECLAILIGTGPRSLGCLGLALRILEKSGDGLGSLEEQRAFFSGIEAQGLSHLKGVPGLGAAAQARILVAFELGRRYALTRAAKSEKTRGPGLLSDHALKKISSRLRSEPQEWLGFVPIYRTGEIGDFCLVERGVRTHVNIEPAELFARVLSLRPAGFVLFHNHPSGQATPSREDLDLTEKVFKAAKLLGLRLHGHWVVTSSQCQWIEANSDHSWHSL